MQLLHQIEQASSKWWRWLSWLPKSRQIVHSLVISLNTVADSESKSAARIHALEIELAVERNRSARVKDVEDAFNNALKAKQDALEAMHKAQAEMDVLVKRCDALQEMADEGRNTKLELDAFVERYHALESRESDARKDKADSDAQIVILEKELKEASKKIERLEKSNREQSESVVHLVRWIQTTHRTSSIPEPNTVKRLLFNAQQSRQ